MDDMLIRQNAVALVTGAALGIGRAAAKHFAQNGMKVVLVDLPGEDFITARAEVEAIVGDSNDVLSIEVDLGSPGSVERLYEVVIERYGSINILMNNAVTRQGRTFAGSMEEWRHSFDVNVWAVVEATRLFQPIMVASGERCAIINVGSKQGITNPPGTPAYNMAKAAIKTFTEQVEHQLRNDQASAGRVTSHLLVPGWTTTGKNEHKTGAWHPEQVVEYMNEKMEKGDFYIICPDDEVSTEMDNHRIVWAATDITENRPPLSRWHDDHKEEASKACS